eukprot:2959679-Pleurochrysis_carterae.AAC.1
MKNLGVYADLLDEGEHARVLVHKIDEPRLAARFVNYMLELGSQHGGVDVAAVAAALGREERLWGTRGTGTGYG